MDEYEKEDASPDLGLTLKLPHVIVSAAFDTLFNRRIKKKRCMRFITRSGLARPNLTLLGLVLPHAEVPFFIGRPINKERCLTVPHLISGLALLPDLVLFG